MKKKTITGLTITAVIIAAFLAGVIYLGPDTDEIKELEGKVDSLTWQAIDAVRAVGNIGAHMEKDVNLVIDIEPDEANLLIALIETLLTEWYVNRQERQTRIARIIEMGQDKAEKSKRA